MKNRRFVYLAFAFLGLVAAAAFTTWATGKEPSGSAPATTAAAATSDQRAFSLPTSFRGDGVTYYVTQDATYYGEWVEVENQARRADIIVRGVVVGIEDSRWNSPDGNPWTPDESVAMPVPYTTFYVKPIAILKGTSKWPDPIPFRLAGGTFGPDREQIAAAGVGGLPDLKVGDEVILFGIDEVRYGAGAVYTPPAYWLLSDMHSLFTPKGADAGGLFVSMAGVSDPAIGTTSEEQIRAFVDTSVGGR
jgi:hypothetical protein